MKLTAKKNNARILSALLVILFIMQAFPTMIFNVNATEPEGITETDPTETETETEEDEFYIDPDSDFEDNKVLVTFKKEYVNPNIEITVSDFPTLNIENIENYITSDSEDNFIRDITITLKTHDKDAVIAACKELSQREDVSIVCPSYLIKVTPTVVPNDPHYSINSNRIPFQLIHAEAAWNTTIGSSNVKVGVIDTQVDNHSDFGSNLITGYDFINNNTVTNDLQDEHGTHVASVIGAKGNNASYSSGVCWNTSIVPIQVTLKKSENSNDLYINYEALRHAIRYCSDHDIQIINYSLGTYELNENTVISIKSWLSDWGGIFVASAGNKKKNTDQIPHFLSGLDSEYVISVGAYNSAGTGLWQSSVYPDKGSNFGRETVDILAPGDDIYVLSGTDGNTTVDGTSVAAPFVTGAAALLKSAYPEATSEEIIAALKLGCLDLEWALEVSKYGCLKIDNSLNELKKIIEARKSIEDGTYVLGTANNSFQVLDIKNSSTSNSIATQIFEANGSNSQKFEFEYHTAENLNHYYTIKNINSGKYLEAAGGEHNRRNSSTAKWVDRGRFSKMDNSICF